MKELRAYLNWALSETHVSAAERADRAVNTKDLVTECWPDWVDCVVSAAESVYYRANGEGMSRAEHEIAWCLEHQPVAFGDLALAFAAAVEAMHAAVPAGEAPAPCDCVHGECDDCQIARGEDPLNYADAVGYVLRVDRDAGEITVCNGMPPADARDLLAEQKRVLYDMHKAEQLQPLARYVAPTADAVHERWHNWLAARQWRDWLAAKPAAPSAMASRRAEAAADAVHEHAKDVSDAAAPTGCAELRRADTGDLVKVKYRVMLQDMHALSAPDGHYWLFRV